MRTRWIGLVVALAMVFTACSSSDEPTGEEAARTTIDAAFAMYNSGDLEGWVEVRDRGSFYESEEMRLEMHEYSLEWYGEFMVAGGQYGQIDCTSQGNGEWDDVADGAAVTGYRFTCATRLTFATDAFVPRTETFEVVASEDEILAMRSDG